MQIPIICEPNYEKDSIWCDQIRARMEKVIVQRKYTSVTIDGNDYQSANHNTLFQPKT